VRGDRVLVKSLIFQIKEQKINEIEILYGVIKQRRYARVFVSLKLTLRPKISA
jgi:hypothetical protein